MNNEGALALNALSNPIVFGYYGDSVQFIISALNLVQQGAFNPPKPQAAGTDGVDKLKKLKELLDAGVLTQAEYEERRNKALAEMGIVAYH